MWDERWISVSAESIWLNDLASARRCQVIATDLPDGLFYKFAVQTRLQKYSASPFGRNTFSDSARPASIRGAYRDRHGRWVRDAMDALAAR